MLLRTVAVLVAAALLSLIALVLVLVGSEHDAAVLLASAGALASVITLIDRYRR